MFSYIKLIVAESWLVVCLGFNDSERKYASQYRAVSHGGAEIEMIDERLSKRPLPKGPCPTIILIGRRLPPHPLSTIVRPTRQPPSHFEERERGWERFSYLLAASEGIGAVFNIHVSKIVMQSILISLFDTLCSTLILTEYLINEC